MNQNDKQERIAEAEKFFNLLFGNVREKKFGYLWTKKNNRTRTYPFDVSNPDERRKMARKAITLNDGGADVYYGINLRDKKPSGNSRATAEQVTCQTATVTDIDVEGGTHISTETKKYPPTFDVAKTFLPFDTSLLVDSGYGLHGLCLYAEPIAITDDNRADCEARNKNFIEVIRHNAGVFGEAVDSVGDLPRVLRCPGTRNYKLGVDFDAPICHVVEVNDIHFTPSDMDTKLTTAAPARQAQQKSSATDTQQDGGLTRIYSSVTDSQDYDQWRARKMLEVIPVADLTRDDWLDIGMALKNNGNACSDWELWSRPDNRYHNEECEKLWQGFNRQGKTIATIHDIAQKYGYSEKSARREWYQLHPELATKKTFRPAPMDDDEDDEPDENFTWTQERIKSCPVNLRLPHNYEWGKFGVVKVIPAKKETAPPKKIRVAYTPIIPTRIFREPTKNKFSYELAILFRGVWHTTEIDGKTLSDPRAIGALGDNGASILEPKILCHFLNEIVALNPDLNEIKAYDQPGWHDGKFIYPTGGKDYVVRRAGFDYSEEFATRGEHDIWKTYFREACNQGGAVARIFLGTAAVAPLIKPLNILNAQIQLNSKSGGGKTALAKLGASLYGNPRELIRTFGATEKNRQAVAAAYNDLPNFFDEMETLNGKRAEEQLSQMIYSFAEGKGNQAQKRDGTARQTFRFYGARLMTAERPILKEHDLRGAYKRLVQIRPKKLFDDNFAAELHFTVENNFGHFGRPWTEFIAANIEEIRKTFCGFGKIFAENPQNIEPTQLKSVTAAAVALQYFLVFLGVKDKFDDTAAAQDIKEIIAMLPTSEQLDDTARAIESLSSFVAGHTKSFNRPVKDSDTGKINEIAAWGNECYGRIFSNGEVAFLPHALKKILEDELHFASADKLIAEWNEQGDVIITDKDRTTHKVAIGDTRTRTIHFRARILITSPEDEELIYYEEMGVI